MALTHKMFMDVNVLLEAKLKLRVIFTGYMVAMVTFYVRKIVITCSPMIGHSFDTIMLITDQNSVILPSML